MKNALAILTLLLALGRTPAPAADSDPAWKEAQREALLVRVMPGAGEAASIGSYTLSLYHTALAEPTWLAGIVCPRNGTIEAAWILPASGRPNPLIAVWVVSAGSGAYGRLDLFEFARNEVTRLPPLRPASTDLLTGYSGHDLYTFDGALLRRSFPIYKETDTNSQPTGGTRELVLDPVTLTWITPTYTVP